MIGNYMKYRIILISALLFTLLVSCQTINDHSITDSVVDNSVDNSVTTTTDSGNTDNTDNSVDNSDNSVTDNSVTNNTTTDPVDPTTPVNPTNPTTPVNPTTPTSPRQFTAVGTKLDVWIDTDLAKWSDFDNDQNLMEVLVASQLYNIRGISISPMSSMPDLSIATAIINAARLDDLRVLYPEYPTQASILNVLVAGAGNDENGVDSTSPAVDALIAAARAAPVRLYVLNGGKSVVTAAAVRKAPDILPKLVVTSVAAWNRTISPQSLEYLEALAANGVLNFTVDERTHQATHIDAVGADYDQTNVGYYKTHIEPYMGIVGYPAGHPADHPNPNVAGVVYGRKAGDSVQIQRIINHALGVDVTGLPDPLVPTNESWGGQYQAISSGYYTDLAGDAAHASTQKHKAAAQDFFAAMFLRQSELN